MNSILKFSNSNIFKSFGRARYAALHGRAFRSARHFASLPHALAVIFTLSMATSYSQEVAVIDSIKPALTLDEVIISAVRVTDKTPVTFSNITKEEIAPRNLGQDIPILLNYLPSVVTTSDAGAGIGYTGIRVRGSDATRVNVTINGIPYNDSESHGTFWVNMPDFASSVESIQLQRGVGTSTNGSGAFGASLNLLTESYSEKANAEISNAFGSFNTRKHTAKFSTGLMNGNFELAGRLSVIKSDGYIDRAWSDLKSYFLQGTFVEGKTLIKALVFGGHERTYQSWNGIDAETMESDRTFNSAGIYTDDFGNTRFYDNEVDDYKQDHYQLHFNRKINENWSANVALHYTKGRGFYENYKEDADFSEYGLMPVESVEATDLVRRKWLDNDFYGTTFSVNYQQENLEIIIGGAWNKYFGDHFGTVEWARFASQTEPGYRFYEDEGIKTDGNVFAKINYRLTEKIALFADLQYRRVSYRANGVQAEPVADIFNFFNPKAGVTYQTNPHSNVYFSYARANREPNRTDYESGNAKPEILNDFELGWRYSKEKLRFTSNIYYMAYQDQLILTGTLDDVGNPVRSNSEKSYRLGLELDFGYKFSDKFSASANTTLSDNRNLELNIFEENVGSTKIAYSPSVIGSAMISYKPFNGFTASLLSKYVGEQYMNNIELEPAKLPDYFVADVNLNYEISPKSIFNKVILSALVNNVFDREYVSNGYMWDIYPYYYPQAGINFLAGATFVF